MVMEKELYDLLYVLKDKLNNCKEKQYLDFCDVEISNDEEIIKLAAKVDSCATKYNDALKFNLENIEEYKNNFYSAKLELDKNEKIIEYYKAYREYKELYDYFNSKIIEEFNVGIKLWLK